MSEPNRFELPPELAASGLLPSPPGVVVEVMRLVNDPNAEVEDLAAVIERDPVLAARLLGTVNSSLYTLVREIHSIADATVLLGFKAVRSLSLGVSVAKGMPDGAACASFDLGRYWSHSLMTAVLGRNLAMQIKRVLSDEAFTMGLLANLGRLVIAHGLPDRYDVLLRRHPWPDRQQEAAVLGFDHHGVGAGLLHRWALPDALCLAVLEYPDPSALPDDIDPTLRQATAIASAADRAVGRLLAVTDGELDVEAIAGSLAADLQLDPGTTAEALRDAADHIGQLDHLLGDGLPLGSHPDDLLAQARDLLVKAAA